MNFSILSLLFSFTYRKKGFKSHLSKLFLVSILATDAMANMGTPVGNNHPASVLLYMAFYNAQEDEYLIAQGSGTIVGNVFGTRPVIATAKHNVETTHLPVTNPNDYVVHSVFWAKDRDKRHSISKEFVESHARNGTESADYIRINNWAKKRGNHSTQDYALGVIPEGIEIPGTANVRSSALPENTESIEVIIVSRNGVNDTFNVIETNMFLLNDGSYAFLNQNIIGPGDSGGSVYSKATGELIGVNSYGTEVVNGVARNGASVAISQDEIQTVTYDHLKLGC